MIIVYAIAVALIGYCAGLYVYDRFIGADDEPSDEGFTGC